MGTIKHTRLWLMVNRTRLLSESIAWFEAMNDKEMKSFIIKLVQDRLTEKGTDGDGDVIGYYTKWTEITNPKKQEGTHYTLDDTHEFYESMFVQVFLNEFRIEADGQKGNENLFQKYGENILGLTVSDIQAVRNKIRPKYQAYARRILFDN